MDGSRVFYASNRAGTLDIYSQPADGSGEAKLELGRREADVPNSFTPTASVSSSSRNFGT